MRDLSDEHDYYRSAVNLELTQQKVKNYGNTKGRVLVCALMSPYDDVAIVEAGDDSSTIRETTSLRTSFSPASRLLQFNSPDAPSEDSRAGNC